MVTAADSDLVLKYKHAKHVGNHGDVLKHCILVQLINESLSDGPINVIDTHAGIGEYTLPIDSECKDGVMRLLRLKRQSQTSHSEELRGLRCKALREYLAAVMTADEHLNEDTEESILGYFGSPLLVRFMQNEIGGGTRSILNHYLLELNSSQFSLLKRAVDSFEDYYDCTSAVLECADGFVRAPLILKDLARDCSNAKFIVLIDPPYKDLPWECEQVSTTVKKLLGIDSRRTTIMVWIPILEDSRDNIELQTLLSGLKEVAKGFHSRQWCCATLEVSQSGLRGSSVWIVNPPGLLYDSIEPALSWLGEYLKQDASSIRWETSA